MSNADSIFDAKYPTVDSFFEAVMKTLCDELYVAKVHLTDKESALVEYGFKTKTGAGDTAYQIIDDRGPIDTTEI